MSCFNGKKILPISLKTIIDIIDILFSFEQPDSQDSSLRRLLLSSQFKNQVSPLATNISDISCLQIGGLDRSKDFRVPLENLQQVRNTSEVG